MIYQCVIQVIIVLIVSHSLKLIYIIFFYYLVSSGIPIVPFTPKKLKNKLDSQTNEDLNKEKEIDNCEKSKINEKMLPTIFVPTSLIINPILKPQKNIYNNNNNKYQKKKRHFTERNGDWICNNCKNLNFAFRQECNRCKFTKKEVNESDAKKEENDDDNNKMDDNKSTTYFNYQQSNKKNRYRYKKYN